MKIAGPANKVVSFRRCAASSSKQPRPAELNDSTNLRVVKLLAVDPQAARRIRPAYQLIHVDSPLLFVAASDSKKLTDAIGRRGKDLFRFVASFGRDKGHSLLKQGDRLTIL